jgi:hypothetical protein
LTVLSSSILKICPDRLQLYVYILQYVYWILYCPHAGQILPKLRAPCKSSNRSVVRDVRIHPNQFLGAHHISWRRKTDPYTVAVQVTCPWPSATTFNYPKSVATPLSVYVNNKLSPLSVYVNKRLSTCRFI